MLSIGLISLLVAIPVFSYRITPSLFNRITSVVLIYSALLAFNGLHVESLASGVGIYSGLFHVTTVSLSIETFLLFTGALLLLGWAPITEKTSVYSGTMSSMVPTISEYSLMILFTSMGAILLLSSSDLVSMYLSIELQSFAVYILATLYRDSESATSAGLKYFLLGGLSSALILLGTALIYSYTGLTQFESIYSLVQVTGYETVLENSMTVPYNVSNGVTCGLLLIGIGFLFKVAAAPLHNWAPDVYDGVPTIVTSWLATMPKISIFVFLLELQAGLEGSFESLSVILGGDSINIWKNLLLTASVLSLIIGTVVGLSQYRIKRLLAYSTISHVGFLLLALAINTEESIESFLFYLIQYSLTNVNTFLVLLAFGYMMSTSKSYLLNFSKLSGNTKDIQFIDQLKGQFKENPLLGLSLAICLFSMAGIPPLIGFFAKQMVLYSSTHGGYYFLSIIAIVVSVISASYYLKIIRVIYFDSPTGDSSLDNPNYTDSTTDAVYNTTNTHNNTVTVSSITNVHSLLIASLTMIMTLFVLQPSILLNSCHLLALSLFYY